jgi:hypothetical protein
MATKVGRPGRLKGLHAREGQERTGERPVHGPCTFIVFGGTGDLARRKILPALSRLRHGGGIDDDTTILAVARDKGMDDRGFRDVVRQAVEDDGMAAKEIEDWVEKTVFYQGIGGGTPEDFEAVATRIAQLEKERSQPPNRIFYLALPPNVFPATIQGLGEAGLSHSTTGEGNGTKYWTRLVIEKPFGRDLQSAEALNQLIHKYFDESQVYRIDHYLGKGDGAEPARLPLRELGVRVAVESRPCRERSGDGRRGAGRRRTGGILRAGRCGARHSSRTTASSSFRSWRWRCRR